MPLLRTALTFSRLAFEDALDQLPLVSDPEIHLKAAEQWLKRAHDLSPDDGVSYGYSIRGGWRPSYRETSGYIATTFFDLARLRNDKDFFHRALSICQWLLDVQNIDGSFSNPRYGKTGIVFDTGQDLFGLVRAYEETRKQIFLDNALRAANWLVDIADGHGKWTRNEHLDTPHTYNTRTAWAVLRLNQVEYSKQREQIARANLDWALNEQQSTGFFENCAFKQGAAPFTHTIAYATRGLLESGTLLSEQRYLKAARLCANSTLTHVRQSGFLPGQIDIEGKSDSSYSCLTGNCQFSIIWAKLYELDRIDAYLETAIRAMNYVMRHQNICTNNLDIRGAIKGSHPIWGKYAPFSFPNWAAKFFVDAMWQIKRCR